MAGKAQLYNANDSVHVPWFTIDLDQDPQTRWTEVGKAYGQKMQVAISTVNTTLQAFGLGALWDSLLELMDPGLAHLQEPYHSELIGLANVTGLPIQQLTLLNLFYEISKGCTSIVAEDPTGRIYHARNQDFGTFFIWKTTDHQWGQTDALRDLLVNLNFVKDGKLLFKGVTFAGHLGILTGLKPNTFTLSTNARFGSTIPEMISYFKNGSLGRNFLMYIDRDVLINATSYDEAVAYIQSVPMYASAYYIVGGAKSGEGAIITRSPNATDHIAV
uniref:ceramidase n=1 Tax=Acrobeloides nanus TaxID=290746 RepID=A0A914ECW2_9BILA